MSYMNDTMKNLLSLKKFFLFFGSLFIFYSKIILQIELAVFIKISLINNKTLEIFFSMLHPLLNSSFLFIK